MRETLNVLAVAGPALAHMTRVLSVADTLREQGQKVAVATEGMWLGPLVRRANYPLLPLTGMVTGARLASGSLGAPDRVISSALETDLALLERERPRVVLMDWRPSMRAAAAIIGIPVISLVNAHMTRHYTGPLAAPEQHPLTRVAGQRVTDAVMPYVSPFFYRDWAKPYQAWMQQHGHAGYDDFRDYLVGDMTLYADLPLLAPTTPGAGVYIGPVMDYPLPYDELPPLRDPVLYVTLGSSLATSGPYAVVLREVVQHWPGSVVVSSGEHTADWPSDWISTRYVNPDDIVARGHRLAWLYHGGNGTSYQLLDAWVRYPAQFAGAIALPFHVEQQWNADKLAALGAITTMGSLHRPDRVGEQDLLRLAEPRCYEPPATLIAQMQRYADAPRHAAHLVQSWL